MSLIVYTNIMVENVRRNFVQRIKIYSVYGFYSLYIFWGYFHILGSVCSGGLSESAFIYPVIPTEDLA